MHAQFNNSSPPQQVRRDDGCSWYRRRPVAAQLIALSIARCSGINIEKMPLPCTTAPKRWHVVAGGRGR